MFTNLSSPPEATVILIFANGNVLIPAQPQPVDPPVVNVVSGFSIRPV